MGGNSQYGEIRNVNSDVTLTAEERHLVMKQVALWGPKPLQRTQRSSIFP